MSFGTDEDFFDDIPGIPDMISSAGSADEPQRHETSGGDSFFSKFREKRQSSRGNGSGTSATNNGGKNPSGGPRLNPGPTNTENTGRWVETRIEIAD